MRRLFSCWMGICMALYLYGQEVPKVTNKVFIENITLTQMPGQAPMLGNILIENGIITGVDATIQGPYDAKVISGDSLHAYAGFIAPLSHIGLEKPKENRERPKVDRTGYPPNDVAGITPEIELQDLYKKDEKSIADFRKEGFTISHTVPYGGMMPGMGSIISINGKSYNDAVYTSQSSMYATWKTANRVFPATLIGIMSKWREMYRNAELALEHQKAYDADPVNKHRPNQDAAIGALFPVISGDLPVFFQAHKHRDISRTLQLQKELGFDLVLSEVKDADRILSHIKTSKAQVLLSLDLPKEKKGSDKKKADKKEDEPEQSGKKKRKKKKDIKKEKHKKKDPAAEALKARKKEASDRYINQAKILAAASTPFSFSYINTTSKDVHSNIRKMIKNGLSKDDALAALTTQAAEMLNISNIAGTIEVNKVGNIVILTKPLFDEKAKVKYVLVDGNINEYDLSKKEDTKATTDKKRRKKPEQNR